MDRVSTTLGTRIRSARLAAGIKQAELGRRLRVTAISVWRWEKDQRHPDVNRLPQLARELSVSIDWLLGVEQAA